MNPESVERTIRKIVLNITRAEKGQKCNEPWWKKRKGTYFNIYDVQLLLYVETIQNAVQISIRLQSRKLGKNKTFSQI